MTDEQGRSHEDCNCIGCVLMTAMGGVSIIENAYFMGLAGQQSGEAVDWRAIAERVVSTGYGVGVLISTALRQLAADDDAAEAPSDGVAPMTTEQLKDLMDRGMTDE